MVCAAAVAAVVVVQMEQRQYQEVAGSLSFVVYVCSASHSDCVRHRSVDVRQRIVTGAVVI